MTTSLHLLLPLLSSVLYVAAAMLLKRAADLGVGVWRTAFVGNIVGAALFTALLALGGPGQPWTMLWQPAVVALLLVAGQCLAYLSLTRGDVSIATPLLGVKNLLVAFFVTLVMAQPVPFRLWLAAALSTAAIILLNRGTAGRHHDLGLTVVSAFCAAAAFALFDVLVQRWAHAWGVGVFLPVMNGFAALYSFALVPLFREPLRAISRRVWPWLLGGTLLIAVQAIFFIYTIAAFRNATQANIVYSIRGVWSVLLVWWFGRWFGSREQTLDRRTLSWRLVGAALMTAAIITVVA